MDMEQFLKDCKIIIPAGFMLLMMVNWFPEYIYELMRFLGKSSIGIAIFFITWEVGKHVKRKYN